MRKLFVTGLFSILIALSLFAQGRVNSKYHNVKAYTRSDGTLVRAHKRTDPNSTNRDNYSTRGNTNPWTLEPGTVPPDNNPIPSYNTPSYTPSTYTRSDSYSPTLNVNASPTYRTNEGNTLLSNFFNTPTTRPSSYSTPSYPTYRALDFSAGERIINYSNGRDEFNVAAPTKIVFSKNLTYYSFDPYDYELKETMGGAEGKLLLNGPYRFYDEEGRLRNAENYRNGLKHGQSTTYDEYGNITTKAEYTLGRLTYQKFSTDSGVTFEVFGELNKPGTRLMLYKEGALFKRIETIGNDLDKTIEYDPETQHKLMEYTKLGNELHGTIRVYQRDGQTLSEVANFKNGLREGETRLYGESGKLKEKYFYKTGEKNGPFEIYNEAGVLRIKGALLNEEFHGQIWYYDEPGEKDCFLTYQEGQLNGSYKVFQDGKVVITGSYLSGEKDGLWNYYWKDSSSYYLAQWLSFQNGVLNGPFREIRKDSVLVGTYKNGILDGEFRAYQPFSLWLQGKPPKNLDEDEILCSGRFWKGKKDGHWKFYSRTGVMFSEGNFQDNLETGEWRYYLERFGDGKGNDLPFAGQLFLIENYLNGKKNGRIERLAYLEQIPVMCDTSIGTVNPLDTCFQLEYLKVQEVSYYKNDELHGPLEWRDADGKIVKKGEFRNGERSGHWIEVRADPMDSSNVYRYEADYNEGQMNGYFKQYDATNDILLTEGYFVQGQKSGIWKEYFPYGKKINTITTYEKDQKTTVKDYNYDGKLHLFATYEDGFMNRIEQYDTIQNRLKTRFDILSFENGRYVMNLTFFNDSLITLRLQYSPGYLQPESDPFLFMSTYEFLGQYSPELILVEGPSLMKRKDGKVIVEGTFHEGSRQGEWKFYFYDQNVLQIIEFEANEQKSERYLELYTQKPYSGKLTVLSPKEGGYRVIKIKKGLRHGQTLKYDREGKLVEKIRYEAGKKKE